MGKFSDKFLGAFMKGDEEYDDEFDEYDDILDEDGYFPEDDFDEPAPAPKKKERIPERVFFNHMWMGGAVGSALAMFILRHKTQHRNFTVTVMILLFVQLAIFSFILGFLGFWTFF